MCQHSLQSLLGDPHTTGAMWEAGAGGQATAASNGQGRQGCLTEERRWAGRGPRFLGQATKFKKQRIGRLTNAGGM